MLPGFGELSSFRALQMHNKNPPIFLTLIRTYFIINKNMQWGGKYPTPDRSAYDQEYDRFRQM